MLFIVYLQNFVETIRPIASASLHVYRRFALTILKCYASGKQTLAQTQARAAQCAQYARGERASAPRPAPPATSIAPSPAPH